MYLDKFVVPKECCSTMRIFRNRDTIRVVRIDRIHNRLLLFHDKGAKKVSRKDTNIEILMKINFVERTTFLRNEHPPGPLFGVVKSNVNISNRRNIEDTLVSIHECRSIDEN